MRKNIYNEKILMIKIGELVNLSQSIELNDLNNKKVLSRVRKHLNNNLIRKYIEKGFYCKEIAIPLDDEINIRIEEIYDRYRENIIVSLESVENAFIWGINNNVVSCICNKLQMMLIDRDYISIKGVKKTYSNELLEYILSHRNFDYRTGINPVLENDKKVLLINNEGELDEVEIEIKPLKYVFVDEDDYFDTPLYDNDMELGKRPEQL